MTTRWPPDWRNVHVLEQAGGVKRLQAGIDLGGVEMLAGAKLEIGADGVGFDAAVAFDDDRSCADAGCGGAANATPGARPKQHHGEEQAGHDQPSFYPHTHIHAQRALIPLVAAPAWRAARMSPSAYVSALTILVFPRTCPQSAHFTMLPPNRSRKRLPNLGRRQMNDVIESCKYHQHQDNSETNPKTYLLSPFR